MINFIFPIKTLAILHITKTLMAPMKFYAAPQGAAGTQFALHCSRHIKFLY